MDGSMGKDLTFDNRLTSRLDLQAPRAGANRQALAALMGTMRAEEDAIRLGGGAKAAEAQHGKGRLTVRERLKLLLDEENRVSGAGPVGRARNVWRIRRRAGRRRGDGTGPRVRPAVHDHRQRCHGEGRRIFPHDGEEGAARADHRARKSHSDALSGRLFRRVSAAAGGCVSRHRRFWPRLSQQRRDEFAGHSADHGHHGHVRGRGRLSAGDDGYRADDRRIGTFSCRAVAGAGGDRAEDGP